MTRYLINFSYDGSKYNGYQKQKGLDTIQQRLEDAAKYINNSKETKVSASGRTDAHVHAINQYAHLDINVNITEYKLKRALNSLLPDDIYVRKTCIVDDNFHARYMVKEKEYIYKINTGDYNPIEKNYIFQFNQKLDVEKMKKAIRFFVGTHDFTTFSSGDDSHKNKVRTIYDAFIESKDNYIIIHFKGSGFLKYMVRIMVGTLVDVGLNNIDENSIPDILLKKDRKYAKRTIAPEGLYLYNVKY